MEAYEQKVMQFLP